MREEFESHLTFHLSNPEDIQSLKEKGRELGLKCTHIVLDRGASVSQPMLTRHSSGTLDSEIRSAERIASQIPWPVSRIKIEVHADSELAPSSSGDLVDVEGSNYFEHHIKLQLKGFQEISTSETIAVKHGARLSRNAFRSNDEVEERFVTQRVFGSPRSEAAKCLSPLVQELKAEGLKILEVEEEYVVYDNNCALDAGWLSEEREGE